MPAMIAEPTAKTTPTPVVCIVDDDAEVRTSLNQLLRSARLTAKTYSSAFEFLEDYNAAVPGCLVLDIRMPGMSGLELQARLASKNIDVPVIMITGYGEVPMVVQAMRTGAFDFIQKPYSPLELLRRIQAAVQRDLERRAGGISAEQLAARLATLTPREQETLDQMLEEIPLEQIADQLGVSVKTAEQHQQNVYKKMQVASEDELRRLLFPSDGGENA